MKCMQCISYHQHAGVLTLIRFMHDIKWFIVVTNKPHNVIVPHGANWLVHAQCSNF